MSSNKSNKRKQGEDTKCREMRRICQIESRHRMVQNGLVNFNNNNKQATSMQKINKDTSKMKYNQ
jgi:hypothetical protein